jgi:hypothetical protein
MAQDILSPLVLSKNTSIKIHRATNMPVVLHGGKILSLTISEEYGLRVTGS